MSIFDLVLVIGVNTFFTAAFLQYTLEEIKQELASVFFFIFVLNLYFYTTPVYMFKMGLSSFAQVIEKIIYATLNGKLVNYFSELLHLPFTLWVIGFLLLSILCYLLALVYNKNSRPYTQKAFAILSLSSFSCAIFFLCLYRGIAHINSTASFSFIDSWLKIIYTLAPLCSAIFVATLFAWRKKAFRKESLYCIGAPLLTIGLFLAARLYPLLDGTTLTYWGVLWSTIFTLLLSTILINTIPRISQYSYTSIVIQLLLIFGIFFITFSWTCSWPWNIFFNSTNVPLFLSLFTLLAALFFIGQSCAKVILAQKIYRLCCLFVGGLMLFSLFMYKSYEPLLQITKETAWINLSPLIPLVSIALFFGVHHLKKGFLK